MKNQFFIIIICIYIRVWLNNFFKYKKMMKYLKQNINNINKYVEKGIYGIQQKYDKHGVSFNINDTVYIIRNDAIITPAIITDIKKNKFNKPTLYSVTIKDNELSLIDKLIIKFNISNIIKKCINNKPLIAGEDIFRTFEDAYTYLIYTDVKFSLLDLTDLHVKS